MSGASGLPSFAALEGAPASVVTLEREAPHPAATLAQLHLTLVNKYWPDMSASNELGAMLRAITGAGAGSFSSKRGELGELIQGLSPNDIEILRSRCGLFDEFSAQTAAMGSAAESCILYRAMKVADPAALVNGYMLILQR